MFQSVHLHCGGADILLCRTWVQWAYNRACERHNWSHLRTESTIVTADQKSGTCVVTQGSITVTGAGLTFAATDVGRQFRVNSLPIYTILTVNTAGATSCTLDQPFDQATAAAATGTILDAYVTMPENFGEFISLLDPVNRWRLHWNVTEEDLNRWDPGRQSSTSPRAMVSQRLSTLATTAGQARYEMWPYGTTARTYPLMYRRKPEILADTDNFIGPFARRAMDVLLDGALARAALWPGTAEHKNPYFNLALARAHEESFEKDLLDMEIKDDEMYPTWKVYADYQYAPLPLDSNWMQSHDMSAIEVSL